MSRSTFVMLCAEVRPYLIRQVTRFRMPVDVDEQLAVTIWRLATNIEYRTISALFGLGISTVCEIVHKTCWVISEHLLPRHVKIPTEDRLKEIVREFEVLWGFPQTVGAIDGTHIPILKPVECPSDYYNRKGFYSVIIQGVVDSHGLFIDVNIGWPGKVHDARVLVNSKFYNKCNSGNCFPNWKKRINDVDVPLVVLGDPAYPLSSWLMKPFSDTGSLTTEQQHYNYRQSRARMVVENAYGQLKGRWRCLLKRMDYYAIQYTIDVVATCVVLHNICERNGDRCDPEWIHQESQIDDTVNPPVVGTSTASGANIRNAIKQYVFQHQ